MVKREKEKIEIETKEREIKRYRDIYTVVSINATKIETCMREGDKDKKRRHIKRFR